jgi:hypothetical protein
LIPSCRSGFADLRSAKIVGLRIYPGIRTTRGAGESTNIGVIGTGEIGVVIVRKLRDAVIR